MFHDTDWVTMYTVKSGRSEQKDVKQNWCKQLNCGLKFTFSPSRNKGWKWEQKWWKKLILEKSQEFSISRGFNEINKDLKSKKSLR